MNGNIKIIRNNKTNMKNRFYIIFFAVFLGLLATVNSVPKDIFADDEATTTIQVPPPADNSNTGGTSSSTPDLPSPISIHLDIEGPDATLFNNIINVSACSPDDSSGPTVNAYCAVLQSGLPSDWSSYGSDKFLNSINGFANDYVNNHYWGWFNNLEYGQTSLNKHLLSADENLLLTINRMPLKISVSGTTPVAGSTTTISVLEFGFDSSFNGIWLPAASSTISIGGNDFLIGSDGVYNLFISTTSPIILTGRKSGFLDSSAITLYPSEVTTVDPPPDNSGGANPSGGGGGGGRSYLSNNSIDVPKAFQFLAENQRADGSFSSSLYTDWAAIAFAVGPQILAKDKIIAYLKSSNDNLLSATDYERHTMALMALGINPYNGTSINYIQHIINKFDGTQVGDSSLINDDIFAIFPLTKSGYSGADTIVTKIIAFIISKQKSDGSWESSVDLTASAVQALALTPSLQGVADSIYKAKNYLRLSQKNDGGFGSSFSTSWAIQAIFALGDLPINWASANVTPNNYLYSLQQTDGGLEPASSDIGTRIWATAYAIPAALGKTWNSLLSGFSKPDNYSLNGNSTDSLGSGGSQEIVATTTVATSTPLFEATSTLPLLAGEATTIATSTLTVIKINQKKVSGVHNKVYKKISIASAAVFNPNLETASVGYSQGGNVVKTILSFFKGLFERLFSF